MLILTMAVLLAAGLVGAYFWNRWMDRREARREVQRRMDAISKALNEFTLALGAALVPAMQTMVAAFDNVATAFRESGLLDPDTSAKEQG